MSLVEELAALKEKVRGNPAEVRKLATSLRTAGDHVSTSTNRLPKHVTEVGRLWQGGSATAFSTYMAAYPKAGTGLQGALSACATALDTAAGALETAFNTIDRLQTAAQTAASDHEKNNSGVSAAEVDKHVREKYPNALSDANTQVSNAEKALTTAKSTIDERLGDGFRFFKSIPHAGGADFDPGDKKVDWRKITRADPTSLSSANGGGSAPGGNPGGGPGAAGGGAGAPSSYGNIPAPKEQVVQWIKEALTIIKSPEMAEHLKKRGLNVSDLNPNDPQDIQRIWTIIHHESGGNPNAINNSDINARNGVPSQGLMQTIPPTFTANALPGYGQIREPVDNIIAGVLYTYNRYGNLSNHPGISSLESGGPYRPY
ncbi:transglycosylase SLT domain-containing protein [Nonomuraea sp. NPDC050404]|uniref:transglycosylase SLT domain-containing protein n=1 Tax=Nonomuraea sp. NPDC050404 TaxID=3155783 RepID=UPI0033F8FF89